MSRVYRSPVQWTTAHTWLGRRVLVTGGSGFLGSAVCHVLLAAGAEVHATGLRRLPPPETIAHPLHLPTDARELVTAVKPEVVLHLAAPVDLRRELDRFASLRPAILDGTIAIAEGCLAVGARMLAVGTCEELAGNPVPFSPSVAPAPTSPYSALKAAATAALHVFSASHGLPLTVVRPFRCYGPAERAGLVPSACAAALDQVPFPTSDGAQIREWNHVDAVAHGLVALAAHPDALGRTLNLGGGPRASVAEVVELIFRLAGAPPTLIARGALPRRPGEVDAFWGDHTATDTLIGPLSQPSLEDGLRDLLAVLAEARRSTTPHRATP